MSQTRSFSINDAAARAEMSATVGRLMTRLAAAFGAWARRRHNRAVLSELTAAQLADIGLARDELGYRPLDDGPLRWDDLGPRL